MSDDAALGGRGSVPRELPAWQLNYAADDYVDYTWHAPTVRLYVAHPTLAEPAGGYRYPDWVRHAMGGVPACIDPMWTKAGAVIATTLIDLMIDPAGLAKARRRVRGAHRRRHRRLEMGSAATAGRFRGAVRLSLAGICRDPARSRVDGA